MIEHSRSFAQSIYIWPVIIGKVEQGKRGEKFQKNKNSSKLSSWPASGPIVFFVQLVVLYYYIYIYNSNASQPARRGGG